MARNPQKPKPPANDLDALLKAGALRRLEGRPANVKPTRRSKKPGRKR